LIPERKVRQVRCYIYGNPYAPSEFRETDSGLRPSYLELLENIDMDDPAWPSIASALREMAEAGVEINEAVITIAEKVGAHRVAERDARTPASRRFAYEIAPLASAGSIVYYVRRGDLIKIGTTADPVTRFAAILPDEILAYEPGSGSEETYRHRQFFHLRCRGEYFTPAPELLEHARRLRQMYGDPDSSWPTVTGRKGRRMHKRKDAPRPMGGDSC